MGGGGELPPPIAEQSWDLSPRAGPPFLGGSEAGMAREVGVAYMGPAPGRGYGQSADQLCGWRPPGHPNPQ